MGQEMKGFDVNWMAFGAKEVFQNLQAKMFQSITVFLQTMKYTEVFLTIQEPYF